MYLLYNKHFLVLTLHLQSLCRWLWILTFIYIQDVLNEFHQYKWYWKYPLVSSDASISLGFPQHPMSQFKKKKANARCFKKTKHIIRNIFIKIILRECCFCFKDLFNEVNVLSNVVKLVASEELHFFPSDLSSSCPDKHRERESTPIKEQS